MDFPLDHFHVDDFDGDCLVCVNEGVPVASFLPR